MRRRSDTLDLVTILSRLVPGDIDGGVSTAPLSYAAMGARRGPVCLHPQHRPHRRCDGAGASAVGCADASRHRARARLPDRDERRISGFLQRQLLPGAGRCSRHRWGVTSAPHEAHLREHIRICVDCCHFAVSTKTRSWRSIVCARQACRWDACNSARAEGPVPRR